MSTSVPPLGPEADDVLAILEQIWSSYLGEDDPLLPQPRAGTAGTDGRDEAEELWSAAVLVAGGWTGTVSVEVATPVAVRLTRRMLALHDPGPSAEPLTDADVADAVGELVNMVGGNVKSLMPGPSSLSLPVVAAGRSVPAGDTVEVTRIDARWQGHPVRVGVHAVPPS